MLNIMRTSLLAAIAIGTTVANAGVVDESQYIELYRDYPVGTWRLETPQGGTWENRTDIVYANDRAVRVTLNADQLFLIRDGWGGINKTGMTAVEFYFYSTTELFTKIDVQAASSAITGNRIRLSDVVTQQVGAWTKVTIPYAWLGINSGTRFSFLRFFNESGGNIQFYLDEVRVIKPAMMNAAITINANNVHSIVPPPMFGAGGSIFNPYFDYPSTKVRVKEAGINAFTYPGGADTNSFDWRTNMETRNNVPAILTVDGFLKMSDQLGADKIIGVNYGSGTPEDARDWVHYANVVRQSNVRYWVIGNENYGVWSYDTHAIPHDAVTYAQFSIAAINMMKAVDPTIKVGINGMYSEHAYPQSISVQNPRTGEMVRGWTPVVLTLMRDAGVIPDFIDVHFYPQGPHAESDNNLLQTVEYWDLVFGPMRQILNDYLGAAAQNVTMNVTENNGVFFNPGKQSVSIVSALYLMKSWVKISEWKAGSFIWWRLHQHVQTVGNLSQLLNGWRQYGDYGLLARAYPPDISPPVNERYPSFFAMKLLKIFARPGYQLLDTVSTNPQITTLAARNPSTGRVNLLICNMSASQVLTATVNVNGFARTESPNVYTYGAEEDVAQRDIKVWRVPQSRVSRRLEIRMQPYSMNVIEL